MNVWNFTRSCRACHDLLMHSIFSRHAALPHLATLVIVGKEPVIKPNPNRYAIEMWNLHAALPHLATIFSCLPSRVMPYTDSRKEMNPLSSPVRIGVVS